MSIVKINKLNQCLSWNQKNSKLGFILEKEITKVEQQYLLSNLSIFNILYILQLSSEGESKKELQKFLGFTEEDDEVDIFQNFLFGMNNLKNNKTAKLKICNGFFAHYKFRSQILDSFNDFMKKNGTLQYYYGSKYGMEMINEWVNKETNGKITKIIDKMSDDVKLVLINAIHFKCDWKHKFLEGYSRKKDFKKLNENKVSIPFMEDCDHQRYAEGDDYQICALELNDNFEFQILLPKEDANQKDVLAKSEEIWSEAKFNTDYVKYEIPKFKMSYEVSLDKILPVLGLNKIFNEGEANFTGMFNEEVVPNMVIDEIKHKAIIEVLEGGVEAAAVTMASMISLECAMSYPEPKLFMAKRTFQFRIFNKTHEVVLFQGVFDGDSELNDEKQS